jgi:hypothetical protein
MLDHLFNLVLASSQSEELYRLGCYASDTFAGYTTNGKFIFYAMCVA